MPAWCGAVAQLGERRVRNAKVVSSILIGSTNLFNDLNLPSQQNCDANHFMCDARAS